jgi:pseudoazurin
MRFHLLTIILFLSLSTNIFAKEHMVKVITDYDTASMIFTPKVLNIRPGDTVTWVNQEHESHNMMTYPDGFPKGAKGFKSPYLERKGDKWSYTFSQQGTYEYHCQPHVLMGMRGTIIVGASSKPGEFHVPTSQELRDYRQSMLELFDESQYQYKPKYVRDSIDRLKKNNQEDKAQ